MATSFSNLGVLTRPVFKSAGVRTPDPPSATPLVLSLTVGRYILFAPFITFGGEHHNGMHFGKCLFDAVLDFACALSDLSRIYIMHQYSISPKRYASFCVQPTSSRFTQRKLLQRCLKIYDRKWLSFYPIQNLLAILPYFRYYFFITISNIDKR